MKTSRRLIGTLRQISIGLALACAAAAGLAGCQSLDASRGGVAPLLDHLWRPEAGTSSGRFSDVRGLKVGENALLTEIEGPGVIRRVWFTAQCSIPQIYSLLVLRIYWDDEPTPSVEVPLGEFFGIGFGKETLFVPLMSEAYPILPPVGDYRAALNGYWPMPFGKKAKIMIENTSKRPVNMFFTQIHYDRVDSLPPDSLYFHSQWRRENPVKKGVPYTILEAQGRGLYAGTVMNYHLLGPGAWVEGGDDFYIDGSAEPTLHGTGAEDYFGHGWGFRREMNGFFHGTSVGPKDNKMTAYRWHIPDPVHFSKSIRVAMRCHGWDVGDREDDYSSVAYWYQTEPHAPFPEFQVPDKDYLDLDPDFLVTLEDKWDTKKLKGAPGGKLLSSEIKKIFTSGNVEGADGAKAFDGKMETKWADVEHTGSQWIGGDFGTRTVITGFILKNCSAGGEPEGFNPRVWRFEVSESTNGPWTPYYFYEHGKTPLDPVTGSNVQVVKFAFPIAANCFRLYIVNPGVLDGAARIPEIEIYGK